MSTEPNPASPSASTGRPVSADGAANLRDRLGQRARAEVRDAGERRRGQAAGEVDRGEAGASHQPRRDAVVGAGQDGHARPSISARRRARGTAIGHRRSFRRPPPRTDRRARRRWHRTTAKLLLSRRIASSCRSGWRSAHASSTSTTPVVEVAGVANGALDATAGDDAGHEQAFDPRAGASSRSSVGRPERARGRLVENEVLGQHLQTRRAARRRGSSRPTAMPNSRKRRPLSRASRRQRAAADVDHGSGRARACAAAEPVDVGNDQVGDAGEVGLDLGPAARARAPARRARRRRGVEILEIDHEQSATDRRARSGGSRRPTTVRAVLFSSEPVISFREGWPQPRHGLVYNSTSIVR